MQDVNDEDEPAAFLGAVSSCRTMADGSLRVSVDVSPANAKPAFNAFGGVGDPVALARVTNEIAVEEGRPGKVEKPYGEQAKALYQSSFFRNPAVWEAIGTDAEYLDWLKRMPSAASGEFSEYHDNGESYCVPAHVRRVEHGSGTAIKPPYSAIPLTKAEHDLAHQKGDSVIDTEEWWSKMRIKYVHLWCWETAKQQLQSENPDTVGFESFGHIPPGYVEGWAMRRDIVQYLPNLYKGHLSGEMAESQSEREA